MTASMDARDLYSTAPETTGYYIAFTDNGQPAVETFETLEDLRAFRSTVTGDYSVGSLENPR